MSLPALALPCRRLLAVLLLLLAVLPAPPAHADSIVVFNELMYHPPTNEAALEWVELHNQLAVDVDLSGWSLAGGISYRCPEGTVIPGGGYLVVAAAPATLAAATGLTNLLGPFTGRLANDGEKLELRNQMDRLMDRVSYGANLPWPVGPDGSGLSLAKRDEDAASAPAESWTVSAQVGGTPGRRNFPTKAFEVTNSVPITFSSAWKLAALDAGLDPAWRQRQFDDTAWTSGRGLFRLGNVPPPQSEPVALPTLFSSGLGPDGAVLPPGAADPHYQLTLSAQSTPPPPAIAATVIQNHPAWLANDSLSSWLGPVNPGTANVAAGAYNFRTTFSLEGFNPATASLACYIAADNQVLDVLFNGVSKGITYAGFSGLSGAFTLTNGFLPGTNTLEFRTQNDGSEPNPGGFRVRLTGQARRQLDVNTALPANPANYVFRTPFALAVPPAQAVLRLTPIVADGAVFYVNGTEVLRWNLPAGAIGPGTPAVSNVPSPVYLGPFELPSTALVMGTNVLAVELHAAAGVTNDLLFGAQLDLNATNILVPPPITLAFNEVGSATNGSFFVELANYGATELDLEGCLLARRGGATNRDFLLPAQKLGSGALVQFDKAALGFGADPGDRLFLYSPTRDQVLDAVVAEDRDRARWPDGTGSWVFPSAPTPGAPNAVQFRHEIVLNEILYHPPSLPPSPATVATERLLEVTNSWRYNSLGQDLGNAWRAPGYDDSAWPAGQALLYSTTSVLPAPKNTELPLVDSNGTRLITWYFRSPFRYAGGTNSAQLVLHPILDDGAVYYLNGAEIYRQNMPAGEVRYGTLASVSVATPAYSGPFTVAVTNLLSGTNWLAVEVHQFTTNPIAADMAFGLELSLSGQVIPALPARESPEAWVELFNRSTNEVDLTGWRLDEGIDYRFAPGTTLAPGGYLVVAQDVAFMQSNYPGLAVVGPFTNRLSHKGDYLALKDASNNVANAVQYYDGYPWPEPPDGGGSSLELRDPWADNAKPEAWAASDESSRSGWSNYTYRAVANNVLGPTLWNEFVLGLLDAGECLVDDLHVIESPGFIPVELLQNGSFETGLTAWRALGNHGASRVEMDPDNPANHVLHLVATGPTDHMHNHLETTFANSRAVVDGREYQVSFRAKWLSGNNRLNTRLYFNRVARTTVLPLPARHGTPGAPNSTRISRLGPTFEALGHSPVVPQPGQLVRLSVDVSAAPPATLQSVTLWWAVDGAPWQSRPMTPGGPASPGYTHYTATLPGQAAGAAVQFYVQAVDSLGAATTYPARGAASRALFKVNDGGAVMSQLHRFRLLMPPADAARLHASTNVMSNERLGCTVIYDERQVFYDVGVHLQGSERGRDAPSRVGFTVRFQPDHLFRGVQDGVTFDRSGGYSGRGGTHDEILLWHAVNHAGNLLGLDCDIAQVFAPRAQENGTALMRQLAFDNDYFDNQYADGGDGGHYLLELIYYPTTTLTGAPESPKLPQPDDVLNVDFQNWGSDPEIYRWIFCRENLTDLDDYSQVIALNQALSVTDASFETKTSQLMDADEWLRTLAFKAFIGDADTFTVGLNHNWKFYFRPDTGQALGLLWDMDFAFYQAVNSSFPGTSSPNIYRFIMLPNNYRRYCNHLLDILTTTMNAAHLGPWAARYAGLVGQDWSSAVTYLQQRADYIRSTLPQGGAFAITSNGGRNFATTNSPVMLTGTAPLTVRQITVNGISRPLTWTSLTNWTLAAPLPARVNQLTLQGLDNAGNPLPTATDSITITNLGAAAPGPVVINEWMADNASPGGFADPLDTLFQDWFELYNPNSVPINLAGYYLTDTLSQPTKWQIPTNLPALIAPHGFLLVWADGDTAQNGLGTNGDLHASFQLSRSGEAIGLFAPDLTPQHTVVFGAQTQNVSQGLHPDGNTNAVYDMSDWSPRAPNRLGTPPAPALGGFTLAAGGQLSFRASVVPGRTYQVEYKTDLNAAAWTALGSPQTAPGASLTVSDVILSQPQRFYRVRLVP